MLWLRKSKKGFTLIELMVVVAIIGVLALLGLRMYSGQQVKAKNAIIKANAGTIQTLIQAELADATVASVVTMWADTTATGLVQRSGIFNPTTGSLQASAPTAAALTAGAEGLVWVSEASGVFTINGNNAAHDGNVYSTSLTARK
jgi:type IV pilus assembly protein PilA